MDANRLLRGLVAAEESAERGEADPHTVLWLCDRLREAITTGAWWLTIDQPGGATQSVTVCSACPQTGELSVERVTPDTLSDGSLCLVVKTLDASTSRPERMIEGRHLRGLDPLKPPQ